MAQNLKLGIFPSGTKRLYFCHPDRGNEKTEWRDLFGSQRSLGMTDWPARVAEVDNRGGRAFWHGGRSVNTPGRSLIHPGVSFQIKVLRSLRSL